MTKEQTERQLAALDRIADALDRMAEPKPIDHTVFEFWPQTPDSWWYSTTGHTTS